MCIWDRRKKRRLHACSLSRWIRMRYWTFQLTACCGGLAPHCVGVNVFIPLVKKEVLNFCHSIRWKGLGFIFESSPLRYHKSETAFGPIYCLMIISLILKLKIVRITKTGRKAYNTKKSIVNLEVAPGKVTSMNWIPWENWQRVPTPAEALEWPARRMFRLGCGITNSKLNSDWRT